LSNCIIIINITSTKIQTIDSLITMSARALFTSQTMRTAALSRAAFGSQAAHLSTSSRLGLKESSSRAFPLPLPSQKSLYRYPMALSKKEKKKRTPNLLG
jgi:hypothetical protein